MERLCEPELMTGALQVQAYSDADFSSSDEVLINDLEILLMDLKRFPLEQALILDLGCGPGNITERLASHWPVANVIGIDGSESMLEVAKARKLQSKLPYGVVNINYLCMDIASIASGVFRLNRLPDVLVSNSLFHHIHDPGQFWQAIKKLSSSRTIHFHKDLRRPKTILDSIELQQKYLPEAPSVLKKDFLASLHAAFTLEEVERQLKSEGLSTLNVSEVDDRYLQIVGTIND